MGGLIVPIFLAVGFIAAAWFWKRRRRPTVTIDASWGRVAHLPRWRRALYGVGQGIAAAVLLALLFGASAWLVGWPSHWLIPTGVVLAVVAALVLAWVRLPEQARHR